MAFDLIWVVPSLAHLGGSEYATTTHARLLADAGHRLRLLTGSMVHPAWLAKLATAPGLELVRAADEAPPALCALAERLLRQRRPDLIQFLPLEEHCLHWLRRGHDLLVAGMEPTDLGAHCWWLSDELKEMIHRLDALMVMNPLAIQHARQLYGYRGPIRLVPNTIMNAAPAPRRKGGEPALKVTCIARLSEEKGVEFLLAAFRLLPERHSAARLDLWGDGEDRPRLQRLARMLGVEEQVSFQSSFDPFDDISAIIAGADVFALSSLFEGAPIALLEMAARGRPVVASATTGAKWICGHDYRWLTPIGDTRAMADAIADLLDSPAARASASMQLYERFRSIFSPQQAVSAFEATYSGMVAREKETT